MKKRIVSLALAVMMLLGIASGPISALAADGVTIKLHYNRPDGNYTDWDVWFWPEGGSGAGYAFAEENGDMVATYEVPTGVNAVGFIVRLGDWSAKDWEADQFIDVSEVTSGTVHVYVESGKEGYEKVLGDDVVTGTKITMAEYREGSGLLIRMSGEPTGDLAKQLTIKCDDGEVKIISVGEDSTGNYRVEMEKKPDFRNTYYIIYEGTEYKITMPNFYSTNEFESQYTYEGSDLGAVWTAEKTAFRVWAPTAKSVKVNLYRSGTEGTNDLIEQIEMTADVNGTWVAVKEGDQNGVYYTYSVEVGGQVVEACDPYAVTTGVNGKRAMIIDLDSTDPEGWENDVDPNGGKPITDAIIYELHVRDLSTDENSGIQNVGKFLGLIETGTTTPTGIPTGLDHIKNLGVTHIHLLPSYDYGSVDESRLDVPQFNWGYDPVNFNVPEGSYSTDPYNGAVRVAEMKQMVKGLHDNGISVIMDVVYNHVYDAGQFCFNKIVPNYFSRTSSSGAFSNGSGCGNDTASERSMVSKYIVDSVKYWADEYHIDGFRFDLVGLIDTDTINAVIEEVHKTHPNVIFYGEGWTMNTQATKQGVSMTTQTNSTKTPEFAFFSDTIRDGMKGSVFNNTEKGYISGSGSAAIIEQCFMGAPSWCKSPTQTVNYASCHDNMSLIDRITMSTEEETVEDRIRMNNLAASIYMLSQGVPFMQAGEEMLRSKPLPNGGFDHNSYKSPDSVNSIKWNDLNDAAYMDVYNYYQGLIAFRKAHPALRMTSAADVSTNITAVQGLANKATAFQFAANTNGDSAEGIFVIFNPAKEALDVTLPEGNWNVYIDAEDAGTTALRSVEGTVNVAPISAMVLIREDVIVEVTEPTEPTVDTADNGENGDNGLNVPAIVAGVAAAAAAAAAGVAAVVIKKRKK